MNPTSPNQSDAHLALREYALSVGMEPALRRFLWEINAHWDLVALPLLCENLQEILKLAQEEWEFDFSEWGIESWPDLLDWIVENKSDLSAEVGPSLALGFGDDGDHPLMGIGVLRHPAYTTLCNSHVNSVWDTECRLLQAHLLCAHINVTRKYTTLEEFESYSAEPTLLEQTANPYHAALAIRSMTEGFSPDLFHMLPVDLPPAEFLPALYSIVPSSQEDLGRYRHLLTFLEKAFYDVPQQKGDSSPRRGSSADRARIHGGITNFLLAAVSSDCPLADSEDAKDHRSGRHSTTIRKRHTGAEAAERIDVDDCPNEDEEDEEIDRTGFGDHAFQKNPGSFHEVSAAQSMQLQMANQMFPWAYGALTSAEIAPVLVHRSREMMRIVSERELSAAETEELEALAFAQVMFWTSSSPEQAKRLRLPDKAAAGKDARLGLLPSTPGRSAQWRIRAPLPNYRSPFGESPRSKIRECVEYLLLDDVVDASALVFAFLRQPKPESSPQDQPQLTSVASSDQPERVFRRPIPWYRRRVRVLFELADERTRMTEGRLSRFFFTRVLEASGGDLSAAAIITGNDVPLARVKLFYACRSTSRLRELHQTAAIKVGSELWASLGQTSPGQARSIVWPSEQADSIFKEDSVYIGNRLCPTLKTVREAIKHLQFEIRRSAQPKTNAEHQRHHNLLTIYTLWFFAYTSGVRGIATPYIDLSEIDEVRLRTTLTDKDSGVGYKSRLVRITPMLHKQMELYKELLSRSPQIHQSGGLPCFFLDAALRPVEVRPRTIVPIMHEFLPFPVNIHRRFVSSTLLDAGCPPEFVSAWMGHWHRGEEPWGKYSSLSFSNFVKAMESYLDPLLDCLGFVPMSAYSRSRGHK